MFTKLVYFFAKRAHQTLFFCIFAFSNNSHRKSITLYIYGRIYRFSEKVPTSVIRHSSRAACTDNYSAQCNPHQQACSRISVLRSSRCRQDNMCPNICKNNKLHKSQRERRGMQRMRILPFLRGGTFILHTRAGCSVKQWRGGYQGPDGPGADSSSDREVFRLHHR